MNIHEWNVELFRMINNLGKDIAFLNPAVTFIAEYMVLFLALGVLIMWFTGNKRIRMMVICAGIAFIVAEIAAEIAGLLYSNHQPFAELANVNQLIAHEIDNSFPSDHTILFFSFCTMFFLFYKRSGVLWLLLASIVGLSRIWAGVHYPGDVLTGALIGIAAALAMYLLVSNTEFMWNILKRYESIERRIVPAKVKSKGDE
ncbi:undecaprenyl-diphosphatase [Virgibacillus siamensis]|uniref:undecaprenyl-diphosphatase n=1 Tax=Virgibacillus siamensis TaxID=480071 RepID=UPI000986167F|nr:undecaprenyl-diphosphatase [Virgibacillus siamensis]